MKERVKKFLTKYAKTISLCILFVVVAAGLACWMKAIINGHMPGDSDLHRGDWIQLWGTVISSLGTTLLGIITVYQTISGRKRDIISRDSIYALPTTKRQILFSEPQISEDPERLSTSSVWAYMQDMNAKPGNIVYVKIPITFFKNIPSMVGTSHFTVAWDENGKHKSCEFASENNQYPLLQSTVNPNSQNIALCLDSKSNDFFNFITSESEVTYSIYLSAKFVFNTVRTDLLFIIKVHKNGAIHEIEGANILDSLSEIDKTRK